MGTPGENHGKTKGTPWENHGKTMGKPWEKQGKMMKHGTETPVNMLFSRDLALISDRTVVDANVLLDSHWGL